MGLMKSIEISIRGIKIRGVIKKKIFNSSFFFKIEIENRFIST